MIAAKPLPPQDPDDPNGWFQYGLPGGEMVKRRNRLTDALRRAMTDHPGLELEVDAGAKTIIVTVWPRSLLSSHAMSRLQAVLSSESNSDIALELFVSESEPRF